MIRSPQAIRLARHLSETGWRFPDFSDDPVVQLAVEEALRVKLGEHDRRQAVERAKREAAVTAEQRMAQRLAAIRAREAGRV